MASFSPRSDKLVTCALFLSISVAWNCCAGQGYKPVCNQGNNRFRATSHNEVEVTVEPPESGGFGEHVCQAGLKWGKQSLVVGERAAEIDLDLFDVDLEGLGPVAAFQIKQSADQCCREYRIYALDKPAHLLRALHGGYFTGADTDLDGRVEIWAEDRAAIDGLDGLTQGEIEHPPTYVLRFERGRLLDTSAAFQDHFDQIIANIRKAINADNLKAFQSSDGRTQFSVGELDQLRKLRSVKVQVLEIVWAYLYSGREKEAWKALRDMWPEADRERIHTALTQARSGGILTQIDGVSNVVAAKKRSQVFDDPQAASTSVFAVIRVDTRLETRSAPVFNKGEASEARPIYLWRPQPSDPNHQVPYSDQWLDLLIDSAGKVRSVKWTDHKVPPDEELMACALVWKFIPALRHGKSVASRLRFAVSVKR